MGLPQCGEGADGQPRRCAFGSFFGRSAEEHQVAGFRLAKFTPTLPNRAVARHRHDEAHFVFVLRGRYETSAAPAPDGSLPRIIYSPPDTLHRDCFTAETDLARAAFATLSISPAAFSEFETEERLPEKGVCLEESAVPLVRRLLAEVPAADDLSAWVTEELCLELLQRTGVPCGAGDGAPPSWLRRARELLRDSVLATAPRSVKEIAATLGVHPVHLARRFRQAFGLSPGQYLRQFRLERARRMMRRTSVPLADIACAAGFADQSHFSNAFRKTFGMTPKSFRRTVR